MVYSQYTGSGCVLITRNWFEDMYSERPNPGVELSEQAIQTNLLLVMMSLNGPSFGPWLAEAYFNGWTLHDVEYEYAGSRSHWRDIPRPLLEHIVICYTKEGRQAMEGGLAPMIDSNKCGDSASVKIDEITRN